MDDFFEIIRILAAICMLVIGSIQDLQFREVSDYLWIAFGIVAIVLFSLQINEYDFLNSIFLSCIFLIPTSLLLWYFGLFGGADAFSLIVLSALAPFATLTDGIITPFTILVNSSLAVVGFLIFNLSRNLKKIIQNENIFLGFDETVKNKILACFLGTKKTHPKFCFSMQKVTNGTKKFNFKFNHAENSEYCTETNSWVSQGIPFIVFILIGFILQVLFGDIVFGNVL